MTEAASTILDDLRAEGWAVAVHNDYRLGGVAHTFWLMTHPDGRWVKGEGLTDEAALTQAWDETRKPSLASRVAALSAAIDAFSFAVDADDHDLKEAGLTKEEAIEAARELRDAAILASGPSVMVDVDSAELGHILEGWAGRGSVSSHGVKEALRLGRKVATKALEASPRHAVTDVMVDAAAEVMWNDRDARMGGTWKDRGPDEVCVIQTKATARAAIEAALGKRAPD